uniref:hypothetical protein n=1 Tax=Parabacteroides distasonis TaxID=823 RepID=UPI0040282120
MDEAAIREVQKEAADALLDVGVSVPIKEWRLPFRRKPVRLRVVMRRPRMNGAIRLMRICLGIGVTSREMESYTAEENMRFMTLHGKEVSRMLAYTIVRGPVTRRVLPGVIAWLLRELVEERYLIGAYRTFYRLMGTDRFTNIIRSAERMNPMKLRLSQSGKGS